MAHPAIPTIYKGIQFRSRLEARWAAFFDLLGWRYQYEPFDLEGWIPDFLILGKTPFLVEVKPVTECPADVVREMRRSSWKGPMAILGCVLVECKSYGYQNVKLGWFEYPQDPLEFDGSNDEEFSDDLATTFEDGKVGCSESWGSWSDLIYDRSGKGIWGFDHADYVMGLWDRAGNLVQWKGKQSVTDARATR